MTKDEVREELEGYYEEADRCMSEDEDYIRGWKSALQLALEVLEELD